MACRPHTGPARVPSPPWSKSLGSEPPSACIPAGGSGSGRPPACFCSRGGVALWGALPAHAGSRAPGQQEAQQGWSRPEVRARTCVTCHPPPAHTREQPCDGCDKSCACPCSTTQEVGSQEGQGLAPQERLRALESFEEAFFNFEAGFEVSRTRVEQGMPPLQDALVHPQQ